MGLKPLSVLFLVSLAYFALAKDGDDLKAVVVLFRHGDRAPLSSWPNDIYYGDSSLWPDGYGQLNNLGKERHYRLGQWFRERYDGFLPKRYNRSDIYVRSTDVDRTLMSAASNLAGLYPPEGDQIWNENVPWQAIPIHTTPEVDDTLLGTSYSCPKHSRLLEELMNSEEIQKLNEEYATLYKTIAELTGFSSVSVNTFSGIFSAATIYKGFNFSLPEWTDTYWPEIKTLAAKDFQFDTYTPDLARLRSGIFIDYLVNHFRSVGNNVLSPTSHVRGPRHRLTAIAESSVPKFLMLSAHDSTIGDKTNAMGIFVDAVPEFASTVIWEVKGNEDSNYINIYHKNSTDFSQLTLPGCDFDCSIEDFASLLTPVTTTLDKLIDECNES